GRPEAVAVELIGYLDAWYLFGENRKLLEVARAADSDAYRNRLRDLLLNRNRPTRTGESIDPKFALPVWEMASDPRSSELPASTALLLRFAPAWAASPRDVPREVALLERVVARHPDDVWVNLDLAFLHRVRQPGEALRYFSAARALRPESAIEMADHL